MNKLLARNTIQYRLQRLVTYALALAIVISGVLILVIGKNSAKQISKENYTVVGQILAEKSAFTLSLGSDYAAEATETLSVARYLHDFSKVCLYEIDGALFSEYLVNSKTKPCYESFATNANQSQNRGRYFGLGERIILPVTINTNRVGSLVIESTGQQLRNTLKAMTLSIIGSLLVALIIAFLFSSRLMRRALMGLSSLRDIGLKVAENPYSELRAEKIENDEIGDLADAFNRMLDVLGEENRKLSSSEGRFRSLSENAPVGVFLRLSVNDYEFVNSNWEISTGLTQNDTARFADLISSNTKRNYIEKLASLEHGEKYVVIEFDFFHEPSGEFRHLQEYVSKYRESKKTYYIGTLIDVTELKQSQAELEKLAYYDPLTMLPNRRFLSDHLKYTFVSAQKKHHKVAVFMTDLDNFKRINDTLGHDAGDRLLQKIGSRLKAAAFKEDVVTRMGGDEFLILVDGIENLNSIEFISKRLLNAMSTERTHELATIPVTGSIGVAVYPDDSSSAEELMRHADLALYHSKAQGGNCFSCYSEELDHAIREQIHVEEKLRKALNENKIDVFLQPQVVAQGHSQCWAEALVRWHDEEEGFISPTRFIPVAEETGLIGELGRQVLEIVCQMLRDYSDELSAMNIQGISVNLSARQFFSDTLVEDIKATFSRYRINPSAIEFELTESTVTDDMDRAVSIMQSLRALGCRLSIDDFGTGYSSLSYLTRFPITSLKIDRSFVDKLPGSRDDEAVACTIINLAHNLGMSVVAEGVETREQADYLASKGCEYLQGYYFAKPSALAPLIQQYRERKLKKIMNKPR